MFWSSQWNSVRSLLPFLQDLCIKILQRNLISFFWPLLTELSEFPNYTAQALKPSLCLTIQGKPRIDPFMRYAATIKKMRRVLARPSLSSCPFPRGKGGCYLMFLLNAYELREWWLVFNHPTCSWPTAAKGGCDEYIKAATAECDGFGYSMDVRKKLCVPDRSIVMFLSSCLTLVLKCYCNASITHKSEGYSRYEHRSIQVNIDTLTAFRDEHTTIFTQSLSTLFITIRYFLHCCLINPSLSSDHII